MSVNMDPLNDVRNILKNVEHKVNDKIDVLGCLKYMNKFSDLTRQQIEAQERQQGSGYSSSLFFDTIRSRPCSFLTLLAALLKLGQTDIYDICIKETRKYYSNKPDVLRGVLDIVEKEKERIGVQGQEPDPVRNEGREKEEPCVRPRTGISRTAQSAEFPQPPPQEEPCVRPRTGISRTAQSAEFPQPPPQEEPCVRPRTGISRTAQSAEFPQPPPQEEPCVRPRTGIPRTAQSAEFPQPPPQGRSKSITLLKRKDYKKLAKELEEKQDRDDNDDDNDEPFCRLWYIIADHDDLNLDITQEDINRIAEARKDQGLKFLNLLHNIGYTLDDLEVMFEHAGMDNAVALLKQSREVVQSPLSSLNLERRGVSSTNMYGEAALQPQLQQQFITLKQQQQLQQQQLAQEHEKQLQEHYKHLVLVQKQQENLAEQQKLEERQRMEKEILEKGRLDQIKNKNKEEEKSQPARQINLNTLGSAINLENNFSRLNITNPKEKATKEFKSLPTFEGNWKAQFGVRDQQLIEDTDSTAPKSSQVSDSRSFGDTVNTQSARGISTVVPSSISDNSSFTSGPVTASNTQALPQESQQNSGGPSPYWQNIPNITDSSQAGQMASPVSAWGHQAHLDRGQNHERTQAVDAECYTSIPISSYAESSVHSWDDIEEDGTSLKRTVAVQPTSAQQQFAPDYRGEAEELRYDRIHQLDNDPSNLPSFQNAQKEQEQQQGETQLPSTTKTHDFRSTMATPDSIDSLNITTDESQANVGTTNATAGETRETGDETTGATNAIAGETRETGDETMGATYATAGETRETGDETNGATNETSEIIKEENKTQNVPRFSLMDSHSSDTADNSVE